MIEEAVFRLFDELADKPDHTAVGQRLARLGWSDIEAEYPVEACELLFRAQGRSLATTDCLDRVMIAELASLLDEPVEQVVLPNPADGTTPASGDGQVSGIVLGSPRGKLVVPVSTAMGTVSVGVVDADQLTAQRLDTFDRSVHWTQVSGPLDSEPREASTEWNRAMAAAQRALATELAGLADQALRVAVNHVSVRVQFGMPIGSFQSPRYALADAAAALEGARALLDGTWRYGGRTSAQTAKAAVGRAHRAVADAALQVCGAIGLTAEHDLHRYVTRGFQIDALCGAYQQLEALLAERLFGIYSPDRALPAIIAWD
ncbi:acyl-CoA dehydrogenase family protein [Mycobacterium paraintracellulare]|uniref:acyl-CoA dehydrogenase family protein n=1 Tax=Mycobacterium paraintracellulare TaxID=1138383 RepID=UPI0019282812|nr:acyl-CoA dehydrogenase family protein [Mycobacterium paraintracellulare]